MSEGLEKIAEDYAEKYGKDAADMLARWDGRPDLIAEDLFRIRNSDGEMEDLKLFRPYQPRFLHAYFYSDAKIINIYKGRRIGFSLINLVAMGIDGIAHEEQFFPIVSTRLKSSESRINDLRKLFDNAKVEIPYAKKPTKGEIVLWNGTTYRAYTGNPDGARGEDSAKTVMIDEMAFLEDQEETLQAFMPFISLGSKSKMVQISTPKVSNDKFMQTHDRGTATGYDGEGNFVGVLSIKQPSFKNADEIDIETSLFEQDVEPVRPDMDLAAVEAERAQDPQGFAQEYLCRPISDEYRFFSEQSVDDAMERGDVPGYVYGETARAAHGGVLVAGVDFGTSDDETAVTVFEHVGDKRYIRYHEVLNNQTLLEAGIPNPDRANPNHIARRLVQLKEGLGVEHWVLDNTSLGGEAFESIIREAIGRGVHGFNFSDKKSVQKMMGDLNYGLRNGLVTLVPNERMKDQLLSIVKIQKEDWSTPKFTGKEHSPDGKDDIAMSVMLAAYPSMLKADQGSTLKAKERAASEYQAVGYTGAKQRFGRASGALEPTSKYKRTKNAFARGAVKRAAGNRSHSYQSRHGR